jgi:hypothetical protein
MSFNKFNYIFSPFIYTTNINEHYVLKNNLLPLIEENYISDPNNAWDWNVHTSYGCDETLPNPINWEWILNIYRPYVKRFLTEFFDKDTDYTVSGNPWYTLYGRGQNANTHEHLPDHFAVVHFLKFNPELHWPITMVNPNGAATKYFLQANPNVQNKIDFNNPSQSYFHPRFTPKINEGDMLIFPGQLEHLVEKNHSDETRITIAFNINVM